MMENSDQNAESGEFLCKCAYCGEEFSAKARFCPSCGRKVGNNEADQEGGHLSESDCHGANFDQTVSLGKKMDRLPAMGCMGWALILGSLAWSFVGAQVGVEGGYAWFLVILFVSVPLKIAGSRNAVSAQTAFEEHNVPVALGKANVALALGALSSCLAVVLVFLPVMRALSGLG